MKKQLTNIFYTLSIILVCSLHIYAQIDSSQVMTIIGTGIDITTAVHPDPFINGVPNGILGSIITAVASFVIGIISRRRTIKRWKKEGKLN